MFEDLGASRIAAFHDAMLAIPGWPQSVPVRHPLGAWHWIELNHRCNALLWAEVPRTAGAARHPAGRPLARCLSTLLAAAATGRAFYRVYRQFKMYNDPGFNPYLRPRG